MQQLTRNQQVPIYFVLEGTPFLVTIEFTGLVDIIDGVEYGIFTRVNDPRVADGSKTEPTQYSLSKERLKDMVAERTEADVW